MIRKIKAIIEDIEDEIILIRIGDIVLEAYPSFKVLQNHNVGDKVDFYVCLETNEWNTSMYIFEDKFERDVFEALKKVSKMGPRTSSKILKKVSAEMLVGMINAQDINGLSGLPGVGKKTAERMIAELSEAFNNFAQFSTDLSSTKNVRDALEALETLGFQRYEVMKIINELDLKNMSTEDIIKNCLTKL